MVTHFEKYIRLKLQLTQKECINMQNVHKTHQKRHDFCAKYIIKLIHLKS